jgi:hypothetical protein
MIDILVDSGYEKSVASVSQVGDVEAVAFKVSSAAILGVLK